MNLIGHISFVHLNVDILVSHLIENERKMAIGHLLFCTLTYVVQYVFY